MNLQNSSKLCNEFSLEILLLKIGSQERHAKLHLLLNRTSIYFTWGSEGIVYSSQLLWRKLLLLFASKVLQVLQPIGHFPVRRSFLIYANSLLCQYWFGVCELCSVNSQQGFVKFWPINWCMNGNGHWIILTNYKRKWICPINIIF